jgi:hypothetical protein
MGLCFMILKVSGEENPITEHTSSALCPTATLTSLAVGRGRGCWPLHSNKTAK